jgi:hypothetical protein
MTKVALAALALTLLMLPFVPALGLGPPASVGERCRSSEDCEDGTACFRDARGAAACMRLCVAGDRVCEDGSPCLPAAGSSIYVCYVGGTRAIGESCHDHRDCARGVCVEQDGASRCYAPCHLDDPLACGAERICAPVESHPDSGFCR